MRAYGQSHSLTVSTTTTEPPPSTSPQNIETHTRLPSLLRARLRAPPQIKTERVEKTKTFAIASMDDDPRARSTYRVDVRTDGPIRANGHITLRHLHRRASRRVVSRAFVQSSASYTSYRAYLLGRGTWSSRVVNNDRSIAERTNLGDAGGALERGTVLGDGRLGGDDAVRGRGRGGVHDGVCVCGSARSIDRSIVGVGAGVVVSQDWSCV